MSIGFKAKVIKYDKLGFGRESYLKEFHYSLKQDEIISMPRFLIVGGGTFGLSAALSLAKHYDPKCITVFERSQAIPSPDAASCDINKIVRSDYGSDTLYTEMAKESIKIFKEWNKTIPLYHPTGVYLTCSDWQDSFEADSFGLQDQPLLLDQAPHKPSLDVLLKKYPQGYFNPDGGWADASLTIQYMAQRLIALGVEFKLGVQVVKVDSDGLETLEKRYQGTVVIAAGAWSTLLIPSLATFIEAHAQPVIHFKLEKDDPLYQEWLDASVWCADITKTGYYGFPLHPGTGKIKIARHGPGYHSQHSSFRRPSLPRDDQDLPRKAIQEFRKFFSEHFPSLNRLDIAQGRLCWYTDTLDGDFVIDKVPGEQFYVCTGGSGHGYKFAPVLGDVLVQVIQGHESPRTRRFKWRVHSKPQTDICRAQGIALALQDQVLASPNDYRA